MVMHRIVKIVKEYRIGYKSNIYNIKNFIDWKI